MMFLFLGLALLLKSLTAEACSLNTTLNASLSPVENNFSSPNWPQGYQVNTTCGWYITASMNHIVVLRLTYALNTDTVKVYDVDGAELSLINSFTGGGQGSRQTTTVYSKFHGLYILLDSDNKTSKKEEGIFASYTAISPALHCSSGNSLDENHSIVLKDPSGVLEAPGNPNRLCYWKIIAPKGRILRVEVLSIQLSMLECVEIVFKLNKRNPPSAKRCEQSYPSFVLYSLTNELGIKYQHYGTPTSYGFRANYTTILPDSTGFCRPGKNSTIYMKGEGMAIASPESYGDRKNDSWCNWNISVPLGNFIKLTFLSFTGVCLIENKVKVYDMTNSTKILLGEFCGFKKSNSEVFSRGNNLVIFLPILSQESYVGFLATYQSVQAVPASYACNYVKYMKGDRTELNGTNGEFASYQYPLPYSNDVHCSWKIEVPVGFIVNVTFHVFDLQESPNCKSDFVEIKQGLFHSVGRFCGFMASEVIQVKNRVVYVDFVTDSSERYPGFHASYTAVPDPAMGPCKTQGIDNVIPLTGKAGRLFSPLYPEKFPQDMECTWIITVPEGRFVRLSITSFDLGNECKNTLEIRDGQNSLSPLLGNFGSVSFDPSVFSSGRYLWVRFQSEKRADKPPYATGFKAFHETVSQLPASFSCTAQNSNHGIELKSETGLLASYNYPLPVDDSVVCTWYILVNTDLRIRLSFDFFNLSQANDCSEDYVKVLDGNSTHSNQLGRYCGEEKPPTITSTTSNLYVIFRSSRNAKYPGFKASYKTEDSKTIGRCEIQGKDNNIPLTGTKGRLFTSLYPQTVPTDMKCTWIITVPEGHFVWIRIVSFFLKSDCAKTTLEIRDGQSSSSELLKTFCGSSFESSVFSSGRYLWVRFQSAKDDSLKGTGFDAFFEMISQTPAPFSCTAHDQKFLLTSKSGTLASYNYPLPCDHSVECIWHVNVNSNSKIKLTFQLFNLSQAKNCTEDYVEVRDGPSNTSDLIGRYCGPAKPSAVTAGGWHLHVAFKSSGKTKYPGFKASYETTKIKSSLSSAKIIAICLGVFVFLCIAIGCSLTFYKKRRNKAWPSLVVEYSDNSGCVMENLRK